MGVSFLEARTLLSCFTRSPRGEKREKINIIVLVLGGRVAVFFVIVFFCGFSE